MQNLKLSLPLTIISASLGIAASLPTTKAIVTQASKDTTTDSLGYGFNVVGGKSIYQSGSLNYTSPILDMNSEYVMNKIKVVQDADTNYQNETVYSASELAQEYGKVVSGSVSASSNTSIGGKYTFPVGTLAAGCNIDVSAMFDMSKNSSWGSSEVQAEEFSYYTIIAKRKSVYLQMKIQEIRNHLDNDFENDLYSVKSESAAYNLFKVYGTHLVRGYTLGGIFEMTNYYASNSSSYTRQVGETFTQQVNAGISRTATFNGAGYGANSSNSTSVGEGYSFTEQYGTKDNNEHAVNNYKLATYGGDTFPGLTIDQAFSFYETFTSAGYMYDIWTSSINSENNLKIVDIPQDCQPIPLWDLLPSVSQYDTAREYLLNTYIEMCADKYNHFKEQNPTHYCSDKENTQIDNSFTIDAKGYDCMISRGNSQYRSSYVSINDENATDNLRANCIVAMDYDEGVTYGKPCKWTIKSSANLSGKVQLLDSNTGVFRVTDKATNNLTFTLYAYYGQDESTYAFRRKFKVSTGLFSGGSGTDEDPYIVESNDEFLTMCSREPLAGNSYKLISDLDFSSYSDFPTIGTKDNPFVGSIDGNYHTIYMPINQTATTTKFGFINFNSGVIKNVTFQGGVPGATRAAKHSYITNFSDGYKASDYIGNHCWSNNDDEVKSSYISSNSANYFGVVVGHNTSDGSVYNVSVRDIDILIDGASTGEFKSGMQDKIDNYSVSVGSIVGFNEGTIDLCDSSSSRATARVHKYGYTSVGGIAGGMSNSQSSISRCTVDGDTLFSYCGKRGDSNWTARHDAYAGGIVGKQASGSVVDCIVKSMNGDPVTSNTAGIYSLCTGYTHPVGGDRDQFETFTGGISASKEAGATIKECLVYTSTSLGYLNGGMNRTSTTINYIGLVAGSMKNNNEEEIANCYGERSDSMPYLINGVSANGNGAKSVSSATWDGLKAASSSIVSSDSFYKNAAGYPSIFDNDLDCSSEDAFSFDESGLKKTFFLGEEFKCGDPCISTILPNGDTYEVKEYSVDYSDYDTHKDVEGTWRIIVSFRNLKWAYTVQTIKASVQYIHITHSASKTDYVEGDSFDPSGLEVRYVKDSGESEIIPLNELDFKYKDIKPGDNVITVKYGEFSCEYYIKAAEKEVSSISIINTPTKTEYPVGTSVIDLTGIKIRVSYVKGEDKIISADDASSLEVIYSVISCGENTITVCYDGYNSASFKVQGVYTVDKAVLTSYISLVDSLKDISDIRVLYKSINKALELRDQLGFYTNADIEKADAEMDRIIESFNNRVTTINCDFSNAIAVTSAYQPTLVEGAGVSTGVLTVLGRIIRSLKGGTN